MFFSLDLYQGTGCRFVYKPLEIFRCRLDQLRGKSVRLQRTFKYVFQRGCFIRSGNEKRDLRGSTEDLSGQRDAPAREFLDIMGNDQALHLLYASSPGEERSR